MTLSNKLIALRKEKGWSQEDFAEKLDVSRQAISRWENGTALPDAPNILRISKLFHVTTDYLLNDDFEPTADNPVAQTATEKQPLARKKKTVYGYLVAAICLAILIAFIATVGTKHTDNPHTHPVLTRVVENKVDPTCTQQGSYDEVLYCAQCGAEVLRTHISYGTPVHQFENEECIVCGEDQRARD